MVKNVAERKTAPDRATILKEIAGELQGMHQLSDRFAKKDVNPSYSITVIQRMYHAEALIGLLEVCDCGSAGGFDPETNPQGDRLYSLEERFAALCRKYPSVEKTEDVEYLCPKCKNEYAVRFVVPGGEDYLLCRGCGFKTMVPKNFCSESAR